MILNSINRKISTRDQKKARLLSRDPPLGNTLRHDDQAALTGQPSEYLPSEVDDLERSLLLCKSRASELPEITNFYLPPVSAQTKVSFVAAELERLFLLHNPPAAGSSSKA